MPGALRKSWSSESISLTRYMSEQANAEGCVSLADRLAAFAVPQSGAPVKGCRYRRPTHPPGDATTDPDVGDGSDPITGVFAGPGEGGTLCQGQTTVRAVRTVVGLVNRSSTGQCASTAACSSAYRWGVSGPRT